MKTVLFVLLSMSILLASCAKGVPVPADFPLKISLPAGSEITSNPGGDIAEKAAKGMNMHVVNFTCGGGSEKVKKHIAAQLKGHGYEKIVIPGMGNMAGGESFSKEGSNMMITFSAAGDNGYMLMTMEMPDFSGFRP